jgi:hypothetical protein
MRFRLALAFLVSFLLIGAASWFRFAPADKIEPNIVAVKQAGADDTYYEEILPSFIEPKSASSSSPTSKSELSSTDIISRSLLGEYIDLATSGAATDASIRALADRYVESIPTLNQTTVINYNDIKTVSNTRSNLESYADTLTEIYTEYAVQISNSSRGKNLAVLGPDLYLVAKTFNQAYTEAALKLRNITVPTPLVFSHLQLVNSYFSSAAAMEALSKTDEDSATAFAGLITFNENLEKEDAILTEISRILTSHGI